MGTEVTRRRGCARTPQHEQQQHPPSPHAVRTRRPTLRFPLLEGLLLLLAAGALLLASVRCQSADQTTAAAAAAANAPAAAAGASGAGADVRINEFMADNEGAVLDERGRSPDWLELFNGGQADAPLEGWMLRTRGDNWTFPPGASVPAGGYLLIFASGNRPANATTPVAGAPLWADLKLSADAGGQLVLLRPDGSEASSAGSPLPSQPANVSFGVPGAPEEGAAAVPLDAASAAPMIFLARPTPGAANAGPLPAGPFIHSVWHPKSMPRTPAGSDILVNITLEPNLNPIDEQKVVLSYVVNWGTETDVLATKIALGPGREVVFAAAIPQAAFKQGDMVRWRAKAADMAGFVSAFPGPPEPVAAGADAAAAADEYPRYVGTVIEIPASEVITGQVPILEWFSPDPAAATTQDGATGQVLYYNGTLYDNVFARRRGVTALTWPKPKLKFELPKDASMKHSDDMPAVTEFGLQSFWFELGERSYMKEPLALQTMRDAGVIAPYSFYLHVRQNGKFYGLFSFVETPDKDYLKRYDLPTSGPLIKSVSGELSNLRWDLPVKEMPAYWEKENRQREDNDWSLLANFSKGLAGGGPVPRSKYIFDYVNLPQVINNMAAQTIINNMDRCTKNFFMYLNPDTDEWYMLPWDMDGSFGQDNGLGGKPGPNYCVLACEQWNSPLYCDSEHPQDLLRTTPWGQVSVTLGGAYAGPAVRNAPSGSGRKLQQQTEAPAATPAGAPAATTRQRRRSAGGAAGAPSGAASGGATTLMAWGSNITSFPQPQGWDNPDRSTVGQTSQNGPLGTYNHLNDAILDVNTTRAMYLRRLRTLADKYLAGGVLAQLANETYVRIKPLADLDAKTWNSGISIDRGYQQITTEFLPIRTEQLLGSLYGPTGRRPLLPEAQPAQVSLKIARSSTGPPGDTTDPSSAFVEVSNPNPFAVDVSGWRLQGPAAFTFPPGAVIPPSSSVYVAADAVAFRDRSEPPRGGQGLLVLSPLEVGDGGTGGGASAGALKLVDGSGAAVHQLAPGASVKK
ncbi:hypothetical protein PLESTM_001196100 [Pleodorina starrii]|nr:hypothetical protein PLESTM_001196100 [Pleodorina starrii]